MIPYSATVHIFIFLFLRVPGEGLGWRRRRGLNFWSDLWSPQVRPPVSVGLTVRPEPRHAGLPRRGAHPAAHGAAGHRTQNPSLLRVHAVRQGVLGGLTLWARARLVPGRLARGRWRGWSRLKNITQMLLFFFWWFTIIVVVIIVPVLDTHCYLFAPVFFNGPVSLSLSDCDTWGFLPPLRGAPGCRL